MELDLDFEGRETRVWQSSSSSCTSVTTEFDLERQDSRIFFSIVELVYWEAVIPALIEIDKAEWLLEWDGVDWDESIDIPEIERDNIVFEKEDTEVFEKDTEVFEE